MARLGRRRSTSTDAGLTLVELIITTLITGLIAALTTALVIGVQKTNQQNVTRQDQIDDARVAVESMSKTLRASIKPSQITNAGCAIGCTEDAFLQGSDFHVQFYSNINNPKNTVGPSRVSYEVLTTGDPKGDLVESIQRPNSNIPTSSGYVYCTAGSSGCADKIKTRVIARNVQMASPLFTFFDGEGAKMTPPANGSLSVAQLKKLLSIELVATVQVQTGEKAGPTTYIQRLMLPNAQAVMKGGSS